LVFFREVKNDITINKKKYADIIDSTTNGFIKYNYLHLPYRKAFL